MLERARVFGERCYLRPFERTDLTDEYLSWVNDTSANSYILAAGFPVNRDMLEQYFISSQPKNAVLFAVCDRKTGKHFGNARLSQIDWVHRVALYGRLVGNPDYRGKGYGTEALILLLRFGFHHLGLNRIWSAAVVENGPSLDSNDRVGMTREGILRQFVWSNGRFHDAVALSMLREDFDRLHRTPEQWSVREEAMRRQDSVS
ncbi:MAG: GNAT family N-acetyltransferase [Hyphomicrobium sp.]